MPTVLTREEIERFHRLGYLSGIPALTQGEVARFVEKTELFEAGHPQDVPWAFDIKCNLVFDWVYENGAHPGILGPVSQLIGGDILLTNSVFRIKEPGAATSYGWHQDSARIVVTPLPVIVYMAFSAATAENGCLAVIPGTHKSVAPFRVARVDDPDLARAVKLELEPGEIAIFSANLVHGSPPNRALERRVAVLHDYTAASARQSRGQGSGQLVMGEDRFGHMGREPVPGPDFEANAAERRRILQAYPENILMGPLEPGEKPDFTDRAAV
jgi:hypothetical protein